MIRLTSFRLALAAGAALLAAVALPASGADAAPAAKTASMSTIRAAHFSPDTPGVDVYLTSFAGRKQTLWQSDLGYGDVSAYRRIPSGSYIVAMRAHGAGASTPAGLKWTLNAKPGAVYTVAAVGTNSKLTGTVLQDSLRSPAKGHGLVRVIQAASRAPSAKLVTDGVVLANAAAFTTATPYAAVPAGTWLVTAQSGALTTSKAVPVQAGVVESVLVLDAPGAGITLRAVRDASAPGATPQGSIDTGAGGTAPRPSSSSYAPAWIAGSLGLLGVCALVLRRRIQVG